VGFDTVVDVFRAAVRGICPGRHQFSVAWPTDLATEHGENDPNKRDRVKQAGWKDGN